MISNFLAYRKGFMNLLTSQLSFSTYFCFYIKLYFPYFSKCLITCSNSNQAAAVTCLIIAAYHLSTSSKIHKAPWFGSQPALIPPVHISLPLMYFPKQLVRRDKVDSSNSLVQAAFLKLQTSQSYQM